MKAILTIPLLVAAASSLLAESLPQEALTLLKKRQDAISRIDETLVAELEKVKLSAMKRGDLDAANAVVALIKEQGGDRAQNGVSSPMPKGGSTAPIRFRPGMKLLWCPDPHKSALFELQEDGRIKILDKLAWQGDAKTDEWRWESKQPGEFTISFGSAVAKLKQYPDSLLFEGRNSNERFRIAIVGF
jgi:hypothetical protein